MQGSAETGSFFPVAFTFYSGELTGVWTEGTFGSDARPERSEDKDGHLYCCQVTMCLFLTAPPTAAAAESSLTAQLQLRPEGGDD